MALLVGLYCASFDGSYLIYHWLPSRNFFRGGKSIIMQISFVMLIFLLFSDQIFFLGGKVSEGGKLLEGI